jgi:hypothetical protein
MPRCGQSAAGIQRRLRCATRGATQILALVLCCWAFPFTLDLVIFDSGTIVRRLAIELAPIRPAKTSVKVFDIAQTTCGAIGSILVNDVTHCRDASGDVADCVDRISTSSKLPVTLSK